MLSAMQYPHWLMVAGHGRVEAAKLLNMKTVPTVRLSHLSDEEKRAYILADNRLAEKAGWDNDILAIELQGLASRVEAGRLTISKDGRTITVHILVSLRHQGGRKQIVTPAGATPWVSTRVDSTLVKAIVRAYRWRDMLETGNYATVRDLAEAENINDP